MLDWLTCVSLTDLTSQLREIANALQAKCASPVSIAYGRLGHHLFYATLDMLINHLGSECCRLSGLQVILKKTSDTEKLSNILLCSSMLILKGKLKFQKQTAAYSLLYLKPVYKSTRV